MWHQKVFDIIVLPTYIIYALSISDEWQEKDCKLEENKGSKITKNVILSKLIQRLFECLLFLFEGFFTFLVALAHRSQLTVCPLGSGSTVVVRCLLHQCVPLHNKENPTFLLWHLVYSRKCSRHKAYPYSEHILL